MSLFSGMNLVLCGYMQLYLDIYLDPSGYLNKKSSHGDDRERLRRTYKGYLPFDSRLYLTGEKHSSAEGGSRKSLI